MTEITDNTALPKSRFLSVKRHTLMAFLSVMLFRIALDISYYHIIGMEWRNRGFALDINLIKLLESYLAFFVILLWIPKKSDRVSNAVLQLFFLVAFIPIQTHYAFSNRDRAWFYCFSLFWFLVIALNRTKLRFSFRPVKEGKYIAIVITIVLAVLSVVLIYSCMGFSLNFDLTKVHELRVRYKEANIPLSGYMISWTAKVVLPLTILVALYGRKSKRLYWLLFVAIACQLFLFTSSGHKSHLFRIPAAIGLSLLVNRRTFLTRASLVFSIVILSTMYSYLLFDDLWMSSLFARRTFLIPAQVSFYYYDFFSQNEIIRLSHSIFKSFIEYPYQLLPPEIIGNIHWPAGASGVHTWANTGIVADGYMNFGFAGIILWSVLLSVLLKIADAVTESRNMKITWSILLLTFYIMVDGAPLTTMLTHGLLFAMLMCFLSPKLPDNETGTCIDELQDDSNCTLRKNPPN